MDYDLQLELFKIRLACKNQSLLGKLLIKKDLNNYINELNLLTKIKIIILILSLMLKLIKIN